jgi:hypothetical protein
MKIKFEWPRPDHTIHFFVGMSLMAITGSWVIVFGAALAREAYNISIQKRRDYLDSFIDIFYTINGAVGGFMLEQFVIEFFGGTIWF